jgi:hypothetical protein
VILYEHPLLGEGIASYLRAEAGVQSSLAPSRDLGAVTHALSCEPRVVIFERTETLQPADLRRLAPDAILIDVSSAVCSGARRSRRAAGLERILAAVRRSGRTEDRTRAPREVPRPRGTEDDCVPVPKIYRMTDGNR